MTPLLRLMEFLQAFWVMDDMWFERDRDGRDIPADNVIELDDYRHA